MGIQQLDLFTAPAPVAAPADPRAPFAIEDTGERWSALNSKEPLAICRVVREGVYNNTRWGVGCIVHVPVSELGKYARGAE
jgi:hypothetical protein